VPLEGGALFARNLEELQQLARAGRVVHPVAHLREDIFGRKHEFLG
jgi:hypothetical protein